MLRPVLAHITRMHKENDAGDWHGWLVSLAYT